MVHENMYRKPKTPTDSYIFQEFMFWQQNKWKLHMYAKTHLDPIVATISNNYVTIRIAANAPRAAELSLLFTVGADLMVWISNVEIISSFSDLNFHRTFSNMSSTHLYRDDICAYTVHHHELKWWQNNQNK